MLPIHKFWWEIRHAHSLFPIDAMPLAEPGDNAPQGPDTGRWNEDILRVLKGDINDLPLPVPTTVRIYLAGPLPGTQSGSELGVACAQPASTNAFHIHHIV